MTYVYKSYPRSLYFGGDVSAKRIVVESDIDEVKARKAGYLMAHETPMESLVATDSAMDILSAQEDAPEAVSDTKTLHVKHKKR